MPDGIIKSAILSLLPPGSLWVPEEGAGFDLFLDGVAETYEEFRAFAEGLASVRDPRKTFLLSDLEREYGILPDDRIDDETRRATLAARIYMKGQTGSRENLEMALRLAGFDVYVSENSPAVFPGFLINNSQCQCGRDTSVCGNDEAFCSLLGGGSDELLVNTDLFSSSPGYIAQCGGETTVCGNVNAVCGRFDFDIYTEKVYELPLDPNAWPFVFFVGGPVTRDHGTGEITNIMYADVDLIRKAQFEEIILKYKPVHSWAMLFINYV